MEDLGTDQPSAFISEELEVHVEKKRYA